MYIEPTTFGMPEIDANSSLIMVVDSSSGHWRYFGIKTFLMAEQTSRTSLWHVEMPKPNLLETSLNGSPVANRHIQTATRCLTGTASRNMVFSFATTDVSSLQIISNVSLPIRNAFRKS